MQGPDPLAALHPWAIDVQLGEYEYTIPALPADAWLTARMESLEDGSAIVPGLFGPEDRASVWNDYIDGEVSPEELRDASRHALEAAGGRYWWEVDRLIQSATHPDAWPMLSGQLLRNGVQLDKISLAGFVNTVWSVIMEACKDEQERERVKMELTMIPAGELSDEELDELTTADDLSDFVLDEVPGA